MELRQGDEGGRLPCGGFLVGEGKCCGVREEEQDIADGGGEVVNVAWGQGFEAGGETEESFLIVLIN